jgi:hypothetical protein
MTSPNSRAIKSADTRASVGLTLDGKRANREARDVPEVHSLSIREADAAFASELQRGDEPSAARSGKPSPRPSSRSPIRAAPDETRRISAIIPKPLVAGCARRTWWPARHSPIRGQNPARADDGAFPPEHPQPCGQAGPRTGACAPSQPDIRVRWTAAARTPAALCSAPPGRRVEAPYR